jgi:hypothetical protein
MAVKKAAPKKVVAKETKTARKERLRRLMNEKSITEAQVDVNAMSTLDLFLKAVAELYRLDKSAPGLSLAWLADKGVYYASFCRYEGPLGEGKQVMSNAVHKTLDGAIAKLAQNWYDGVPSGRALRDFVRQNRAAAIMGNDFFQDQD